MKGKDDQVEDVTENELEANLEPSQDSPEHSQSKGNKTLKICRTCKFKTRDQVEYYQHMLVHPKCPECGTNFPDNESLNNHKQQYHVKVTCETCSKDILKTDMEKHTQAHLSLKRYKSGVQLGKITTKRNRNEPKEETIKKKRGLTGYTLFCRETMPATKAENLEATNQEMFKLLAASWKNADNADKSDWERIAKEENARNVTDLPRAKNIRTDVEEQLIDVEECKCVFCDDRFISKLFLKEHIMSQHLAADPLAGAYSETDDNTTEELIENTLEEAVVIVKELATEAGVANINVEAENITPTDFESVLQVSITYY